MLVDFYCSGRDALYVCCGWCMPDGAFPLSGVIVNNIKLFGRIDLNLLTRPAPCIPVGLGVGWIFSLCNFWIASSGSIAFCGVVCCGLSVC